MGGRVESNEAANRQRAEDETWPCRQSSHGSLLLPADRSEPVSGYGFEPLVGNRDSARLSEGLQPLSILIAPVCAILSFSVAWSPGGQCVSRLSPCLQTCPRVNSFRSKMDQMSSPPKPR